MLITEIIKENLNQRIDDVSLQVKEVNGLTHEVIQENKKLTEMFINLSVGTKEKLNEFDLKIVNVRDDLDRRIDEVENAKCPQDVKEICLAHAKSAERKKKVFAFLNKVTTTRSDGVDIYCKCIFIYTHLFKILTLLITCTICI
jgi:hypothetical protein